MKTSNILIALSIIFMLPTFLFAQKTYVPDDNFEQALIDLGYDTVLDDSVLTANIDTITILEIGNKNIDSITGIENFTSLIYLYCFNNNISELKLASNTNLKGLYCSDNQLENLDLSLNTNLTTLHSNNNNIIDLDLSSNTNLNYLYCRNNQLTGLNIQNGNNNNLNLNVINNPNLTCIQVDDEYFAYTFDWGKDDLTAYSEDCSKYKPEMTYVPDDNFEQFLIDLGYDVGPLNDSVPSVQLKSIEVLQAVNYDLEDLTGIEDFYKLSELHCGYNNLSQLDLSKNIKLKTINCNFNQLTSLNVSTLEDLEYLRCESNNLTKVDVSSSTRLIELRCYSNQISSLNLSSNTLLSSLDCNNNSLINLNLKNGNPLRPIAINANNNPNLFCIQVNDREAAINNTNWLKDSWANYSIDCCTKTYVPDDNFEQALIDLGYDSGSLNDSVPTENISDITNLDISNSNIFHLKGLEDFISLQQLNIANNNLIFSDILFVQDFSNFVNFSSNFTYSPQDTIGDRYISEKFSGESVSFTIDGYEPGENDIYQWYLNDTLINGADSLHYLIENIQPEHAGNYHCRVTNSIAPDLTLYTRNITLVVNEPAGAGVPLPEYNALVDFYNNMNGDNWTRNDNWLDTLNHSVNDWYGVWVEFGHVNTIAFNNINVEGEIPASITNLSELKKASFNKCKIDNKISDGLVQIPTLTNVFARECNLTDSFNDIISNSHDSLQIINLDLNNISGTIPDEIGERYFKQIWITGNNITGIIPSSIGNLHELFVFYAADNNLTGTIPAEFGNITRIQTVILSNNKIEGPLPIELKNLVNLEDFILDNNLLGVQNLTQNPPIPKSAMAEAERQIPDELSNLIALNQLKIENNNLMFNDVEPIFSWSAHSNLDEFTYSPQNKFGTTQTINKIEGENIVLSFDNYYPGDSDTYQWFKNGSLLNGENAATLSLTNLQTSDAGEYVLMVTNPVASELELTSETITLQVTKIQGSGVPVAEYNALKDFYLGLDGENWEVNTHWLDTVNASVSEWFGVTVSDGHVTKIDIHGNNLTGELPYAVVQLPELNTLKLDTNNISGTIKSWIDLNRNLENLNLNKNLLSGEIHSDVGRLYNLQSLQLANNQLEGEIPGHLVNIKNLHEFRIDSNLYTSVNIEPVFDWGNYNKFSSNFIYAPQHGIGKYDSVSVAFGSELVISVPDYTPGEHDVFSWYKDSVLLPGETASEIQIAQATHENEGKYFAEVSNSLATDLVLFSEGIKVKVSGDIKGAGVSLADYNALVKIYNDYNGPNWDNNTHWLDTVFYSVNDWYGITVENGNITGFEMPNNNLSAIPEELADLSDLKILDLSSGGFNGEIPKLPYLNFLESLNLGNNLFTTKDLTPLTAWSNYNKFKDNFVYTPQPGISINGTKDYVLGGTIELEVHSYTPDVNDSFEWFKNGNSVQNGSNVEFTKTAWTDDNNAEFYCVLSNSLLPDLAHVSDTLTLSVEFNQTDINLLTQLKNVYNVLEDLWSGDSAFTLPNIVVENGKVIEIDLSGLGLSGSVSPLFAEFEFLQKLNLEGNNLSGEFPNPMENDQSKSIQLLTLDYLNIANNNFVFAQLEPAADYLNAIETFIYSPQPMVGQAFDTTIYKYENVTFTIDDYIPGVNDIFTWEKDGNPINGGTNITFSVENAALQDSGFYTCSITNLLFPDLTLYSDTSRLKVLIPVSINDFNSEKIRVYPNPADERIFVETGNQTVNIKVINISGQVVLIKNNFISNWIELNEFHPGIYLLNIESKNSEKIIKKVIVK